MEKYKIGFVFNKGTGEYIGTETIYVEKRTGNYPHADNVTFVEPLPVKEHQVNVWNGSGWNIVPDYRGEICFDKEGHPVGIVDRIGDVDFILLVPPKTKAHEKLKWNGAGWDVLLEKGYKYDEENNPVIMTRVERIKAGEEELPDDMKLEDDTIVFKTKDELFSEGKLTVDEYNKRVDGERLLRYQAETDPMAMMYLRGECTKEEWLTAMDKIRAELPKKD